MHCESELLFVQYDAMRYGRTRAHYIRTYIFNDVIRKVISSSPVCAPNGTTLVAAAAAAAQLKPAI